MGQEIKQLHNLKTIFLIPSKSQLTAKPKTIMDLLDTIIPSQQI